MRLAHQQFNAGAVTRCQHCGKESPLISQALGLCTDCIREEISRIAAFIASLSQDIPYALLAFHPQFVMRDLPPTSRRHAHECLEEAKAQGLRNVRIGNIHVLGDYY